MNSVRTLAAGIERIEKESLLNTERRYKGYAQYMKVGEGANAQNLFMLDFRHEKDQTKLAEKIISTGTYIYEFKPEAKEIRFHEIPRPQPGQDGVDDSITSFLLGIPASKAQTRYQMQLIKEDEHYIYVDVIPREERDKAQFIHARIVLNKKTYLPAQFWFRQPNKDEVTWNMTAQANVNVDRRYFDKPALPEGWKLTPGIKQQPAPRVIRTGER